MRSRMCGALAVLASLVASTVWLPGRMLAGDASGAHAGLGTQGRTGLEDGAQAHAEQAGGADGKLATRTDPDRVDLGAYRWKRRLLLVFAPSAEVPEYVCQEGLLAGHRAQLADRDVTEGAFFLRGRGHLGADSISATAAAALRLQLGVASDRFEVLLVGKDGGIKLNKDRPIGAAELITVIDAMPMRRAGLR